LIQKEHEKARSRARTLVVDSRIALIFRQLAQLPANTKLAVALCRVAEALLACNALMFNVGANSHEVWCVG
jgi:hypothetical protein